MMYDAALTRAGEQRRTPLFRDLEPSIDDFGAAVRDGLSRAAKALPCRFLYDAEGSKLFDQICSLPEYYPTRTETKILARNATEIAGCVGSGVHLIELGSGSSLKVRLLLDALDRPDRYIPIDINGAYLKSAANAVQADYPDLAIEAICADYSKPFALPPIAADRRLGFYPGSTIGNLTPGEARAFLSLWASRLGSGASMLIGVDLAKSAAVLDPAYNDSAGVTAKFTLNILERANRELNASFNTASFRHQARYLADEGRVAVHLVSLTEQIVRVAGDEFTFAAGEQVHVEDSWKYSLDGFCTLARSAGFRPVKYWLDDDRLFSVHLLRVDETTS